MNYPSLEEAIYYAALAINEQTAGKTEATSAVYRMLDGGYGFAAPKGSDERANVSATLKYPKGSALMALVHNHPEVLNSKGKDGERGVFSGNDIDQATKLGLLSAIIYGDDMSMRTYEPGKDKIEKLQREGTRVRGERYSAGKLFDYIPEVRVSARKYGGLLESLK